MQRQHSESAGQSYKRRSEILVRYLVVGLVGLVLWLVSGLAEFGTSVYCVLVHRMCGCIRCVINLINLIIIRLLSAEHTSSNANLVGNRTPDDCQTLTGTSLSKYTSMVNLFINIRSVYPET